MEANQKIMNQSTRIITSVWGVILAIGGLDHGIFEILQGNKTTPGLIIKAIGSEFQMWHYGTEEAFTLIPNFLITGMITVCISLALAVWSVGFIHTKHGRKIFLLLCFLSLLTGGGIGQLLFFMTVWAFSTRMDKSLSRWARILSGAFGRAIGKWWLYFFTLSALSFLTALFIAITGIIPGITDSEIIINIDWTLLLFSLVMICCSYISGFARDLSLRSDS